MKIRLHRRHMRKIWAIPMALVLVWGFSGSSLSADYATGQVTSAILLQERINLTVADKAITSLGTRDGLIKGDILVIAPTPDVGLGNPIAECAVISLVDEGSSVCQIIKARVEVQRGNFVSIEKLRRVDEKFYPLLYNMMARTVDPYQPHKKVHVYIHDIFDEHNSVTALSKRIQRGLESTFSQKARIRLHKDMGVKDFIFYPSSYRDTAITLNQAMLRAGVDVVISGTYALKNGNLHVTLYRFDRLFGEEGMAFRSTLTSLSDLSEAGEIVQPFRPVEKKEYISARVILKSRQYIPDRNEIAEIIANEANGDVFKVNALKRTGFNIISPVDVVIKVDNVKLHLGAKDDIIVPAVEKGIHRVSVSFRRGYFANNKNSLLYSSTRDIEKEVMVNIDKDGDLYVEVHLNPSLEKENIDFRIYKQTEKTRLLLKAVHSLESGKALEYFKD